ncbi:guanylate kinase [Candidatus Peregrinibacteria bacterium CG_4_10_14_0_2_um_filter_43_11]|nr:MAG: guanylate kinase [Candidatus Peregrinibacteria bacterium CG_4_10_14_0_2_um_filter_43_11]
MKGKLFLIVGPSGSGKSSVLMELKMMHPEYIYPLSATTRPMREGEKEGDIYDFYTKKRFEEGIQNGDFLEHAVVHQDYYYGLLKQPVLKSLKAGEVVVREVDIQGFDSIRRTIPAQNMVSIFITTANKNELIDRIVNRAKISNEELGKRMESMHHEFARAKDCDYLVENQKGELKQTVKMVSKIIQKESKR